MTVNISSQPLCCKRGTVFPPEGVVGTNQWSGAQALRAGLQSAQAARGVGSPPPPPPACRPFGYSFQEKRFLVFFFPQELPGWSRNRDGAADADRQREVGVGGPGSPRTRSPGRVGCPPATSSGQRWLTGGWPGFRPPGPPSPSPPAFPVSESKGARTYKMSQAV